MSSKVPVVLCDVYANHLGDVCLRSYQDKQNAPKGPPHSGVIFAELQWTLQCPRDEEDYPTYEGFRGVCAVINDPNPPVEACSPVKAAHSLQRSMKSLISKSLSTLASVSVSVSALQLSLDDLLSQKAALYHDLALMKLRHFTCREQSHSHSESESEALAAPPPSPSDHTSPKYCRCCFKSPELMQERKALVLRIEQQDEIICQYLSRHYE
jgi:hypothetical protein